MSDASGAVIQSAAQFDNTPASQASRWGLELAAAKEELQSSREEGTRAIKRYLDDRSAGTSPLSGTGGNTGPKRRRNLFHADVETRRCTLYGRIPSVDSSRRFSDAQDHVGRAAAEMQGRVLNADIERDGDGYADAMREALMDWLLPGVGVVRLRYEVEHDHVDEVPAMLAKCGAEGCAGGSMCGNPKCGTETAAAVPEHDVKTSEDVETDYVYWRHFLWSAGARTWGNVRWVAFMVEMSRDQCKERFGDKIGAALPFVGRARDGEEAKKADPWGRVHVWEIWSKDDHKTYWYVEGYSQILDSKDDTLGLEGFFPCPPPLMANVTSERLVPRPDFEIGRDGYDAIDILEERIFLLKDAIRVAGVYDKTADGVARLLTEDARNVLIPVDNWALFAEKGGVQGAISWLPLDQVVAALKILAEAQDREIALQQQVTGSADIMRGQSNPNETLGAQQLKARFGGTRIQDKQDRFAEFASDTQKLRAEIMAKHFDPQTIIDRSNVMQTADAPMAQQAVELLRSKHADFRVVVKPESISMTDSAANQQEGVEIIQAIGGLMQSTMPMMQTMGAPAIKMVAGLVGWMVARLRGGSSAGAIIEAFQAEVEQKAQQAAMAPPAPPPPDPKVVAQQIKSQADQQHIGLELQADMARTQATAHADVATHAAKAQIDAHHAGNAAALAAHHAAGAAGLDAAHEAGAREHQAVLDALAPGPGGEAGGA